MNINDLKILGFNASTMAISFTNAERALKNTFTMCFYYLYSFKNYRNEKQKR
jgi:hypothetical protein